MKKLLSVFLALIMLFAILGTALVASAEATTFSLTDEDVLSKIRPLGRYEIVDTGIACDWTASGIEFTAECSEDVSITLTAACEDIGKKGSWNEDCYFTVFIDGVRQSYRVRTMDGRRTVNIAENVEAGTHTFKIVKQTEYTNATVVFNSISFDGTLGDRPSDAEHVIEFIGDSLTSGYGSLDTNNMASRYSDGTRTFAYLTAENFGAEPRVVSVSGGTIESLYTYYIKNKRNGGAYDYSLKKPTCVVITLGTNDGPSSVNYWQTNLQKFANAIRQGYNDYHIPILFLHNICNNDDKLRSNVVLAFNNLKEADAEKYSELYITSGNDPQYFHPGQLSHLRVSYKLTRELVEYGLMPIEKLRSDATVTLTKEESNIGSVNKFDAVTPVDSAFTGITGELVSPLDPDDAQSDTAKAVKYTADGTQNESIDLWEFQIKAGTISNTARKSKGVEFYINYKDKDYTSEADWTAPRLFIGSNDRSHIIELEGVKDGETTKYTLYWDTMPYVNYVMNNIIKGYNIIIGIETVGACEYTVDNMNYIDNVYQYSANQNCAYKYTIGYNSYKVVGVTDNYAATTTTLPPNLIYGDCNSDTKINMSDVLLLRKYLARWDVSINEDAADVNNDGRITMADVLLLRKYIARWDVVLG